MLNRLLFCCLLFSFACTNNTERPTVETEQTEATSDSLKIWNVNPFPEATALHGGYVLVSHFGQALAPTTQDGDGYIAAYDANGQLRDTIINGLDAPKGLEVSGNQLFIADVDSLHIVSIKEGIISKSYAFTGQANFLNGLALSKNDNAIYISATDAGKVWKVDLATDSISLVLELPAVNGLALNKEGTVLYAVQYNGQDPKAGYLYAIDLSTKQKERLGDYAGLLDGLVCKSDMLYFTDWNPEGEGKLLAYNLKDGITDEIVSSSLFEGPADFEVLGDGLALIPMLTGSRIAAVRLN